MKKLNNFLLTALVLTGITATAQVKVGDNPTTINASALLEMESTSKGLLISRMTSAQRTAIASPASGLQVYDTDTKSFWYFDGTNWIEGSTNVGGSKWTNDSANGLVKLTNLSNGTTSRSGDSVLSVTDKGYLGIGTLAPSANLHIKSMSTEVTGTYSYVVGESKITGTGTNFTQYFKVGDYVIREDFEFPVLITNVTDAEITMAGPFQNISINLSNQPAKFLFKKAQAVVENADIEARNFVSKDGSLYAIKYDNTSGSAPAFLGKKYSGTVANPLPAKNGHVLVGLYGAGGTASNRASLNVGAIRVVAAADFDTDYSQPNSATNVYSHPSYIDFAVTNFRATSRSEAMRIVPGGSVGIGIGTPTSRLHVNSTAPTGTITTSGTTVTGTSTNFTSAFRRNDRITAEGQTRVVTDVISATELTVDAAWSTDLPAGTIYRAAYRLNVVGDAFINGLTVGRGGGNDVQSVAIGNSALNSGTTSVFNVAIGNASMNKTTTGNRNVAVGDNTLGANTTGYENVAIGARALVNNTEGFYNTAVGRSALSSLTTGSNNTVLGRNAGSGISTGNNNTIIGTNMSSLPANLNNNIIIADGAGVRKIQVDSLGLVALNTDTFNSALNLKRGVAGTGIVSHIMMHNPSSTNGDGASIDFWGSGAAIDLNNPSARISMLRAAAGAHGAIAFSTRNFENSMTTTFERMRIVANGNVGIGTTTPTARLDVAGEIRVGQSATAPTPQAGMIRYNTSNNKFEGYTLDSNGDGTANDPNWVPLH